MYVLCGVCVRDNTILYFSHCRPDATQRGVTTTHGNNYIMRRLFETRGIIVRTKSHIIVPVADIARR
jgi:hypothetical protein